MNVASHVLLYPGDVVCNLLHFPEESEHRMVLRSFLNTMFWGAASVTTALYFAV